MIEPRPAVRSLHPYRPGRNGPLDRRLVNLASNENAWGPSPAVAGLTAEAVAFARYPDMAGQVLRDRLAARWNVSPDHLLLGAGSGHLIKCLAETYLDAGDVMVDVFPTFSLYAQGARLMGADHRPLPGDGHRVAFDRLPEWVRRWRPKLVFLCSPNNPTGDAASPDAIRAVLEATGDAGLVVVDEAYADFADPERPALTEWLRQYPQLAVLRTFSKAYGLASARVGVLAAHPAVVDAVGRVREPFPVTGMGLALAAAAVADDGYRQWVVEQVRTGRQALQENLAARGWRVNRSQGNFVWAVPPDSRAAGDLQESLAARDILVRRGDSFGVPDHLRITVGTSEEQQAFLAALDDRGA
jgi:histidinol-phosphate aminotransferase